MIWIFTLFKTTAAKVVGLVIISLIVIALLYAMISKLNLDPKVLGMVKVVIMLTLAILGFAFTMLK